MVLECLINSYTCPCIGHSLYLSDKILYAMVNEQDIKCRMLSLFSFVVNTKIHPICMS